MNEKRRKEKRWHIGIENTGSSTDRGTKARMGREKNGDAQVNVMTERKGQQGTQGEMRSKI